MRMRFVGSGAVVDAPAEKAAIYVLNGFEPVEDAHERPQKADKAPAKKRAVPKEA